MTANTWLIDHPGLDLLSKYPTRQLSIEVKGRARIGNVELTEDEWVAACNLRRALVVCGV